MTKILAEEIRQKIKKVRPSETQSPPQKQSPGELVAANVRWKLRSAIFKSFFIRTIKL
jgi:hypothetical protein